MSWLKAVYSTESTEIAHNIPTRTFSLQGHSLHVQLLHRIDTACIQFQDDRSTDIESTKSKLMRGGDSDQSRQRRRTDTNERAK